MLDRLLVIAALLVLTARAVDSSPLVDESCRQLPFVGLITDHEGGRRAGAGDVWDDLVS